MKLGAILIASLFALIAFAFMAESAQVNTSGRCQAGQSCEVGTSTTTIYTIVTDDTGDGTDLVLPAGAVGTAELTLSEWIGAFPPATCTAGQIFIDTAEGTDTNCTTTSDNSLCLCVATNTWAELDNN